MGPEFMSALPIAGLDGTLGSRLTKGFIKGNIRAKSGSMTGLSSLAGYLTGDDGQRYSFAIMINGFIGKRQKYHDMIDEILASMFNPDDTQLANVK